MRMSKPSEMKRRLSVGFLILTAVLCGGRAYAEVPVRFVVAKQVILADHEHSGYLQHSDELATEFNTKFKAAFPNQVLDLDDPEQTVSAEDHVVLIIPTITIARMTDERVAGTIHNFDAFVVGDVSAVDPWTDASLYSGTRMVYSKFKVGDSEMPALDRLAGSAFKAVSSQWMDKTIEQMRTRFAPFALTGKTLPIPEKARKFTGGIWPYGFTHGVRTGKTLRGTPGKFAKVIATFPHYSIIEDVANPTRIISGGEQYSLTIVEKPTERGEPLVQLAWLGASPSSPVGEHSHVLSVSAMLSLFDNYLTKDGGVRILPHRLYEDTEPQLEQLDEEMNRASKGVVRTLQVSYRANLVQEASENPDRKIELGIVERYHGTRVKPSGAKENYYRVTIAACLRERTGPDNFPVYAVSSVLQHVEELANVEEAGVREVDPESVYLTLFRNAVIHIAEKLQKMSPALNRAARLSTL